jgi:FkbM family methyltransferase
MTIFALMRLVLRRSLRRGLALLPHRIRQQAARVPFSRFHRVMRVFDGRERVEWRGVTFEVNPAEIEGYFLFFLGRSAACGETELDLARELCDGQPTTFFDIGANVGVMSLLAANSDLDTRVWAFEPGADAAARFKRNIALNTSLGHRLTLREEAVTNTDGAVSFFEDSAGCEMGGVLENGRDQQLARLTRSVRIDSFCRETGIYPDVMKIDVEGAELLVLDGMQRLPSIHWPRAILVEVHGNIHPDGTLKLSLQVQNRLTGNGYELFEFTATGRQPARAPESWPSRVHILALRSDLLVSA